MLPPPARPPQHARRWRGAREGHAGLACSLYTHLRHHRRHSRHRADHARPSAQQNGSAPSRSRAHSTRVQHERRHGTKMGRRQRAHCGASQGADLGSAWICRDLCRRRRRRRRRPHRPQITHGHLHNKMDQPPWQPCPQHECPARKALCDKGGPAAKERAVAGCGPGVSLDLSRSAPPPPHRAQIMHGHLRNKNDQPPWQPCP